MKMETKQGKILVQSKLLSSIMSIQKQSLQEDCYSTENTDDRLQNK